MSESEKRQWIEQTVGWLRQRGYEITSDHRTWLERYYDGRPELLKQLEREEREHQELLRRIREEFGEPGAASRS